MGMVARNEGADLRPAEAGADPQLPIQQHPAGIVGDAAKLVAAQRLDLQGAEQVPGPGRIGIHLRDELRIQMFAAGLEHELMPPHLVHADVLGFTAEET